MPETTQEFELETGKLRVTAKDKGVKKSCSISYRSWCSSIKGNGYDSDSEGATEMSDVVTNAFKDLIKYLRKKRRKTMEKRNFEEEIEQTVESLDTRVIDSVAGDIKELSEQ